MPDRRVKYTLLALRGSLLELMREKDVSRITVKELCERADVNRGTFYAHYASPADLLEQIEQELLERCSPRWNPSLPRARWPRCSRTFSPRSGKMGICAGCYSANMATRNSWAA